MHTKLRTDLALSMVGQAAMALERNGHAPGVQVYLDLEQVLSKGSLSWPRDDMHKVNQYDHHRITELGAETVALVLAHRHREWRIIRRMQRGGRADWLLEDARGGTVALEVSGVDRGSISTRLSEKLKQVGNSPDVDQRWASVVGFEEPTAALRSIRSY